jgi:hypothetical protein
MAKKQTRRTKRKTGGNAPPSPREALLGVVVGRKGVGKTHNTLEEINKYAYGGRTHRRRVLLFDVNNEFTQFAPIALKDIKHWCSYGNIEVRRVSIFKAKGDENLTVNGQQIYKTPTGKMTLNEMAGALFYILKNYFVGLLLIEDINKYTSDSMPNDLIGAICTQRHVGVDIIIHFQNIGRFGHPKIVGNANWLRFHKVTDSVGRHKDKFEDIVEPLRLCELMVNKKYSEAAEHDKKAKSFHVFWDADAEKIKGAYTKKDYVEAVETYLRTDKKRDISSMLKEEDLYSGEKLYSDRPSLIKKLIQEKIDLYYGN